MAKDWKQYSQLYLQCFADCIPVRGASNSAIYDLTRKELITFPTEYFAVLDNMQRTKIGDLLEQIQDHPSRRQIIEFLDFLEENEVVMLTDDPSKFPSIANIWEFPGLVQNAIIDVSNVYHDFVKIFEELSTLGCQNVQIRCFSELLTLSRCCSLLDSAQHKSITGIELILRHESGVTDDAYTSFVKQHPILVAFTVHSAPKTRFLAVDNILPELCEYYPQRSIHFTTQVIDSEIHCGTITQEYLTLPTVPTFFETKLFNGCLNKKISIDSSGNVKNCPSMKESYGNILTTSLLEVVRLSAFKDKWGISKDQISICRDCEFRYSCSDCRAYLENPSDAFSKPLKCGYDPYLGTWTEWAESTDKMKTARFYGIEPVPRKN